MTDVLLHLGAHKTGTTYLQRWWEASDQFFADNDSIFVPGRAIQPDVRSWRRRPRRDRIPESIPALLSGFTDLRQGSCLLSWEGMLGPMDLAGSGTIYPDARLILEVLRDQLRGSNTKVGFAVRNYADWVESSYKWLVRRSRSFTFATYLEAVELDALTWGHVVTAMRDLFGEENVFVWSHEAFRRNAAELNVEILRFYYGAGVDLSSLTMPPEKERNTSSNAKALEFARIVHELLEESDQFSRADLQYLNPRTARFVSRTFTPDIDPHPPTLLDDETARDLTARYEDDCRALGIGL